MAFGMSKNQLKQRDELLDAVRTKQKALNGEIAEYNDKLAELREKLEESVNDCDGAISDLRNFIESVRDEAQSEYDDKSEKWQQDDKGQSVLDWINTFDAINLEDVDIELPEGIAEVEFDCLDEIEALEAEPSY
jgi:DNA repair ATPase RecN